MNSRKRILPSLKLLIREGASDILSHMYENPSAVGGSKATKKWEMDGDRLPVSVRDYGMIYECFSFDSTSYPGIPWARV